MWIPRFMGFFRLSWRESFLNARATRLHALNEASRCIKWVLNCTNEYEEWAASFYANYWQHWRARMQAHTADDRKVAAQMGASVQYKRDIHRVRTRGGGGSTENWTTSACHVIGTESKVWVLWRVINVVLYRAINNVRRRERPVLLILLWELRAKRGITIRESMGDHQLPAGQCLPILLQALCTGWRSDNRGN